MQRVSRAEARATFPCPRRGGPLRNCATHSMNPGTLRSTALLTAASLAFSGCANMTPGENAAVFGSGAGILAGSLARHAGLSTGESIAVGAAAGAVVAMTAYIIAKHQATERQRRIAEQRARVYYGRLSPAKKTALKQKRVRYIAVDTEKNEKTSPKAKKAVMIYDTQSNEIVGNNVYDVQTPPPVGSTAKFETRSAEYVGGGG